MSEIIKGSVVSLRSGGLPMTVLDVRQQNNNDVVVTCIWFDSSEALRSENFSAHVLKLVE